MVEDFAQTASKVTNKIGASDEVASLREQITKLTDQIKEFATPEGIDDAVHESPYIIAGVALVVGLVIGGALSRKPQHQGRYWS